jgi:hypothetical protein
MPEWLIGSLLGLAIVLTGCAALQVLESHSARHRRRSAVLRRRLDRRHRRQLERLQLLTPARPPDPNADDISRHLVEVANELHRSNGGRTPGLAITGAVFIVALYTRGGMLHLLPEVVEKMRRDRTA